MAELTLALSLLFIVGSGGSLKPVAPQPPVITGNQASSSVIFIGDSITQFWDLNAYFPGKGYINKGIAGQKSSEIYARFQSEVIDAYPGTVVILAGTNDLIRNVSGSIAESNILSMVSQARAAGIKVVVCTVPPVAPDITNQGSQFAGNFNPAIEAFDASITLDFIIHSDCDYHRVLSDANGLPLPGVLRDGIHPSPAGYALMKQEVERFLN